MNAPTDAKIDTETKKRDRINACSVLVDTITTMATKYGWREERVVVVDACVDVKGMEGGGVGGCGGC